MKWTTLGLSLTMGAILALTGCSTMAPKYSRPAPPVPASWPTGPAYGKPGGEAIIDVPWRDFFVDEKLRKVIALALENNRDLRLAALNIERSRAQYRIQRSGLFPAVNASASETIQRVPETVSGTGDSFTSHQYSIGLGFSA